MNKSVVNKVVIPKDVIKELEDIEDGGKKYDLHWKPEHDAVLLKYYPLKHKKDMVRWFKKRYGFGSDNTLRLRYRKLTESKN